MANMIIIYGEIRGDDEQIKSLMDSGTI